MKAKDEHIKARVTQEQREALFALAEERNARGKPVHTARVGNVRVPVYRNGRGFCVAWRQFAGAGRQRDSFKSKTDAVARAEEIARALANSQADVLILSSADRDNYRLAVHALAPLGIPLHAAIAEYTAARRTVAPHSIAEAAAFFAQRHPAGGDALATADITAAILDKLRHNPVDPKSRAYIATIKPRLAAFAAAFPLLADATAGAVEKWLMALQHRGRAISPKTFNHYRSTVALVWRWAALHHRAAGPGPIAGIKAVKAPGAREVFTVGEMRQILAHSPGFWLPYIVLGAFAGLRVCEVARLAWTDLVWEQGEIRIGEHVAGKRGSPRNVPMCDALRVWLAPWRQSLGRIYPITEARLTSRAEIFYRALESAIPGFRWKANGLRHSFGSYHAATHGSLELTRTIMGTSLAMLRHHYNSPQFRNDAAAFWQLHPDPDKTIRHISA